VLKALFGSLEGRGRKGFGGRKIYGKIEKSFNFLKEYFLRE